MVKIVANSRVVQRRYWKLKQALGLELETFDFTAGNASEASCKPLGLRLYNDKSKQVVS